MSIELLKFGLPDPVQANVIVKPYDCLALFANWSAPRPAAQLVMQSFNDLVTYYRSNGLLTTFYIGDVTDFGTSSALAAVSVNIPSDTGYCLMWIRNGGQLNGTCINLVNNASPADLDAVLRFNSRHDTIIDSVLPYQSWKTAGDPSMTMMQSLAHTTTDQTTSVPTVAVSTTTNPNVTTTAVTDAAAPVLMTSMAAASAPFSTVSVQSEMPTGMVFVESTSSNAQDGSCYERRRMMTHVVLGVMTIFILYKVLKSKK